MHQKWFKDGVKLEKNIKSECKNHIIEAGKFFLLLVQGLDQMAPVPFQVAEARLIVGQGIVLCLTGGGATSIKEFLIHRFPSFPLLMVLS